MNNEEKEFWADEDVEDTIEEQDREEQEWNDLMGELGVL